MIANEYAQLAESLGLAREQGIYYGILKDYAVTFLDGTGCHRLMITTRFDTPQEKDALMAVLDKQDLKGLFGIRKLQIAKKVVHVAFRRSKDAMEKIRAFIEWFFPLLPEYGASTADICVQCQEPIPENEAQWVLRDSNVAFRMHSLCARELMLKLGYQPGKERSLAKGLVGAAIYAVLGSLVWLLLQSMNWMAPIAGLAIGWLAVHGYSARGGAKSKAMIPTVGLIATVAVALGVVLGELPALAKIPTEMGLLEQFFTYLADNAQFREEIISNFGMGAILMVMGVALCYRNQARRTNVMTATYLGPICDSLEEGVKE